MPGKTVTYSIRTAVDGSAWAPNVTIAYPAAAQRTAGDRPFDRRQRHRRLPAGHQLRDQPAGLHGASILGAKIVRIEMPIGAPASALRIDRRQLRRQRDPGRAARQLLRPCPHPRPKRRTWPGWAKAFGPGGTFWAKRTDGNLAIQSIEFGNETSYGYQYGDNAGTPSYQERAKNYAVRLKEAAEAISADRRQGRRARRRRRLVGQLDERHVPAVPNLGSYVAGWVSHPYGTGGRGKLEGIIKQAAAHGAPSNMPIDITEWGLSTDGSSA